MDKKILITGSNGFLGKSLKRKLSALGFDVYTTGGSKDVDLTVSNALDEYFSNLLEFEYIFHLAVKTAAGGYCQKHSGEQYIINQLINNNVLNYWFQCHRKAKFITFGSSCGYDDDVRKIEENYMKGETETGYEVYGMIKRMLLVGLQALNKEFDMDYLYFIPSTIYGPDYELSDKHFIFDLIRKICDAKYLKEEPVVLWGTGDQRRELIYLEDCINIITGSLDKKNEVINLSTGNDNSIKEYAQMICDIVDYDFNRIEFDINQFVGAKIKRIENIKNSKFQFIEIKDGLKNTIDYYKKQKYGV